MPLAKNNTYLLVADWNLLTPLLLAISVSLMVRFSSSIRFPITFKSMCAVEVCSVNANSSGETYTRWYFFRNSLIHSILFVLFSSSFCRFEMRLDSPSSWIYLRSFMLSFRELIFIFFSFSSILWLLTRRSNSVTFLVRVISDDSCSKLEVEGSEFSP